MRTIWLILFLFLIFTSSAYAQTKQEILDSGGGIKVFSVQDTARVRTFYKKMEFEEFKVKSSSTYPLYQYNTFRINSIEKDNINFTISSLTTNYILKLDERSKIDTDDDGIYDLELELRELYSNSAKFMLKKIEETYERPSKPTEIIVSEQETPKEPYVIIPERIEEPEKQKREYVFPKILLISVVVMLLIALLSYILYKKNDPERS